MQTLLDDINAIREAAGATPYAQLPAGDRPIHRGIENLFGADGLEITPNNIRWVTVEVVDHEEDAMMQTEVILQHECETPESVVLFLWGNDL